MMAENLGESSSSLGDESQAVDGLNHHLFLYLLVLLLRYQVYFPVLDGAILERLGSPESTGRHFKDEKVS